MCYIYYTYKCTIMESETFTKKYNFRLPDRTIEYLDKMVERNVARNRTDALIFAVDLVRSVNDKSVMDEKLVELEKKLDNLMVRVKAIYDTQEDDHIQSELD